MNYIIFLSVAFVIPALLPSLLKKTQPGFHRFYLLSFLIPLIIPFPQIERLLLFQYAGFEGTFLSLLARTYAELVVIFLMIRVSAASANFSSLLPALLWGWSFGLSKLVRDVILVLFHPLHRFYGYSQFTSFLSPLFLVRGILEAQIEVAIFGFFATWLLSRKQKTETKNTLFLGLILCVKSLHVLVLSLAQSMPWGALISILYTPSILPLICTLSYATLFITYRKVKKTNVHQAA